MHAQTRLTASRCHFKGGGDTRLNFFVLQSKIFYVFSKRFAKCGYLMTDFFIITSGLIFIQEQ